MGVKEDGRVLVVARTDEASPCGYLRCEVDNRDSTEYSATVNVGDMLPKEIHEKMVRVDLAMASVDEIPVCALRVTKFKNHFVLTYRLNHAFFDQNSIVYMFTFLSHLYNQDGTEPTMDAPHFIPRAHIAKDHTLPTENFDAFAPKGYMSAPMPELSFGPPITVKMFLDAARVDSFRKQSGLKLSSNDILHAVLGKALATGREESDTNIRVLFARNMRGPLGLGRHVAGDYVRLESLSVPPQVVCSSSLLELAEMNRALVEQPLGDAYVSECAWFLDFRKHHAGRPNVDFLMDQSSATVTNWSSFPYEQIQFGDSVTAELLLEDTPMMTHNGCFARVSFQGAGSDRRLIAVVNSMNQCVIDNLRAIAAETGLFSCE
jgi:hypothetical protein